MCQCHSRAVAGTAAYKRSSFDQCNNVKAGATAASWQAVLLARCPADVCGAHHSPSSDPCYSQLFSESLACRNQAAASARVERVACVLAAAASVPPAEELGRDQTWPMLIPLSLLLLVSCDCRPLAGPLQVGRGGPDSMLGRVPYLPGCSRWRESLRLLLPPPRRRRRRRRWQADLALPALCCPCHSWVLARRRCSSGCWACSAGWTPTASCAWATLRLRTPPASPRYVGGWGAPPTGSKAACRRLQSCGSLHAQGAQLRSGTAQTTAPRLASARSLDAAGHRCSPARPPLPQVPCPSIFGEPSKQLSIIIPAYNEAERLPATLQETLRCSVQGRVCVRVLSVCACAHGVGTGVSMRGRDRRRTRQEEGADCAQRPPALSHQSPLPFLSCPLLSRPLPSRPLPQLPAAAARPRRRLVHLRSHRGGRRVSGRHRGRRLGVCAAPRL